MQYSIDLLHGITTWDKYTLTGLFPGNAEGSYIYQISFDGNDVAIQIVTDEAEETLLISKVGFRAYSPIGGAVFGPAVPEYVFKSEKEYEDVIDQIKSVFEYFKRHSNYNVVLDESLAREGE